MIWYVIVGVLWVIALLVTVRPHLLDGAREFFGRSDRGRCPVCSRTFEDCRCSYHDPDTCGKCVPLARQLQHPPYGGVRPVIPRQGRVS
ncbi:hypothetical protein [Streptomyces sp. NPDC051173]|uniref:hypothetical protein n=1 Tax=Streptomyces sp. NPDC051173 TaxID=3155164 RepID=UPI00344EC7BE